MRGQPIALVVSRVVAVAGFALAVLTFVPSFSLWAIAGASVGPLEVARAAALGVLISMRASGAPVLSSHRRTSVGWHVAAVGGLVVPLAGLVLPGALRDGLEVGVLALVPVLVAADLRNARATGAGPT